MKDRYTDRRLYFNELAQTSREYLIGYNGGIPGLGDAFRRTSADMQEEVMPHPFHTSAACKYIYRLSSSLRRTGVYG